MIKEYSQNRSGFDVVFKSEGWQMAVVTYDEQYDEKKHTHMARHMTTDEVFVLTDGSATLCTIDKDNEIAKISLAKNKMYVVEKGTWHSLILSRDAVAVAVENIDVSAADTERKVF